MSAISKEKKLFRLSVSKLLNLTLTEVRTLLLQDESVEICESKSLPLILDTRYKPPGILKLLADRFLEELGWQPPESHIVSQKAR